MITIETLFSRRPLARRALVAEPGDRVTWIQEEAEDGVLSGAAKLGEPCSFIVGEGWCSGREVVLESGGSVKLTVDVPRRGRYLVMPAIFRQQLDPGTVGAELVVDGDPLATVDVGGAGPQGVTPLPGYFDIVTIDDPVETARRTVTVDVTYSGEPGHEIRLDAILLQPLVEWHVIGTSDASQALLRSFSRQPETQQVRLPSNGLLARSYDQSARLVGTTETRSRAISVTVPPGGFAPVSSWE